MSAGSSRGDDVKANHLRLTLSASDKLADETLAESAAPPRSHLASESPEGLRVSVTLSKIDIKKSHIRSSQGFYKED